MENKGDFQKEGKEDILLENSSKNSISSKKKKRPRKKDTENATSTENKLLLDNPSHQQSIAGSIPIESKHENDESAIYVDKQTANDAALQYEIGGEKSEAAKKKKKRKPRKGKSKTPASFPEINDVQNSKDSICQGCNEHNNGECVAIECVTTIPAPIVIESDEKKSAMVCKIDNDIHGHMDLTSLVSIKNEQDISEYVIDESTLAENGQIVNDPTILEGIVQSDAELATIESEEIINAPLVFRRDDENTDIPITVCESDSDDGQLSHEVINQTSVGFATVDKEEKDCENLQEDKDIATYDSSDLIFGDSIGYVEMKEGGGQVIYNDNEQSYSERASQRIGFENSIIIEDLCLVTSESERHLSDLIINEDKQFDDNQTYKIMSQNFRFSESVTCEESDKNRDDRVIYESVEQEGYDAIVYNSKEEICSSVSYDKTLCDSADLVSENPIVTDKNCDLIISNSSSEHCHELMTSEFNKGLIVHEISKLRGCCENLEGDDDKFCDNPVTYEFHELDDSDPIVSRSKKRVDEDNIHHDSNGQNDAYTVVFENHKVTLKSNKQSEEVPVNTGENSNSEETTGDCEAATYKHVEQNRELGDFPLTIAVSEQNYCCNEIAIPYESDSKPCHQSANHEFDEQNDADLVASKSEKPEIEDHAHCNMNDQEDGIPVISERDEQISNKDSYCENILENNCDAVEQHFDPRREPSDFPLVVRSEVEYQGPVASEHNQDGSPDGNGQDILNEATPEQDEQKDSDVVTPLYEEQKDSNVVAPVYDEQSNNVSCDNKLAIEIGNSTRPKFSSSFVTIRKFVQRYQELQKQSLKRTSSGTLMPLKRRKSEMKPKSKGLFEMFAGLQVFCFLLACHAICVLLSVLKRNLLRSN